MFIKTLSIKIYSSQNSSGDAKGFRNHPSVPLLLLSPTITCVGSDTSEKGLVNSNGFNHNNIISIALGTARTYLSEHF